MTDAMADIRRWFPERAAAVPMNAHRIVRVSGADAAALLQGQFSNDIAALDENPGQLSSYSSPKGRVLAFLRVLKHSDGCWLVVDAAIFDAFVQRLGMFVLRAKVTIEPADDVRGIALAGIALPEVLAGANLPAPKRNEAVAHGDCVFLGLPGPVPRVEIFGPGHSLPAFAIDEGSNDDLARWDILCGLPRISDANRDAHIAQHMNLDELGAISFRKGCYTGQEIIARMKYLGRVKKRAAVFLGGNANAGDVIRTGDDRAAGEIVNIAPADSGQLMLAVANLDDRDKPLTVNGHAIHRVL